MKICLSSLLQIPDHLTGGASRQGAHSCLVLSLPGSPALLGGGASNPRPNGSVDTREGAPEDVFQAADGMVLPLRADAETGKGPMGKKLIGADFYPDRQRTPGARGSMDSLLHGTEGLEPFTKVLETLRLDPRRQDHPSFTGLTFDGLCTDLL